MSNLERSELTGRCSSMEAKTARRQELLDASIDDAKSAGLIDDFYTDFAVTEEDRAPVWRGFLAHRLSRCDKRL